MNTKVAALLFAIGLGAASGPALASCEYYCSSDYRYCINSGAPAADCEAERTACLRDMCGYDY